jgi:hypothetical protein
MYVQLDHQSLSMKGKVLQLNLLHTLLTHD